ncbi:MAG: DUF4134 domain-containing protein [Ginsengibacter sp.]
MPPVSPSYGGVRRGLKGYLLKFNKVSMTMKRMKLNRQQQMKIASLVFFSLNVIKALAQDGNAGINEANTQVRSYFDSGTNLMYAVGAILGLIGAVKVYSKWNHGDPDTGKVAAAWFGSCVFLVVVATVIRSFFGI